MQNPNPTWIAEDWYARANDVGFRTEEEYEYYSTVVMSDDTVDEPDEFTVDEWVQSFVRDVFEFGDLVDGGYKTSAEWQEEFLRWRGENG